MIKADLSNGIIAASGSLPELMQEFTVLTTILLKHGEDELSEEQMFNILSLSGQLAVEHKDNPSDGIKHICEALNTQFNEYANESV